MAKLVDDLFITGDADNIEQFVTRVDEKFKFGAIAHGPGTLDFFFGMTIDQRDDYSIKNHTDQKLNAIDYFPLFRVWGRQTDYLLSKIESALFMSVNFSIGWLGIATFSFCAFFAPYL